MNLRHRGVRPSRTTTARDLYDLRWLMENPSAAHEIDTALVRKRRIADRLEAVDFGLFAEVGVSWAATTMGDGTWNRILEDANNPAGAPACAANATRAAQA